ncbi:MAG: prepilin peptidase, partial [Planctomycetota bacterium]
GGGEPAVTLLLVLAAAFGAVVGSFLNVVIYRLPRGESFGLSRSRCPQCGAGIAWYDNIPLLSYAVLRGRCRHCSGRISPRYPLVEAVTAALFALGLARTHDLEPLILGFLVYASFVAVLVAAAAIDFQHKLLPDKLTLRAGPVVGVAGSLLLPAIHGTSLFGQDLAQAMKPGLASLIVGLVGAAVGAGAVWLLRAFGTWIARREAMGLGDVKFLGMCGLLLGPIGVLLALGVGIVTGGILGVLIWAVTRNREIPFGPFLALGAASALFYGSALRALVGRLYGF